QEVANHADIRVQGFGRRAGSAVYGQLSPKFTRRTWSRRHRRGRARRGSFLLLGLRGLEGLDFSFERADSVFESFQACLRIVLRLRSIRSNREEDQTKKKSDASHCKPLLSTWIIENSQTRTGLSPARSSSHSRAVSP